MGAMRPIDLGTASAVSVAGHMTVAFALLGIIHLANSSWFDQDEHRGKDRFLKQDSASAALEMEIELSEASDKTAVRLPVEAPRRHTEITAGGSKTTRLDQDRKGRGGDDQVRERALNLADQDDGITRVPSSMTHLDISQLPRIDTRRARRAYEDWRASREPMELTFVAMGETGTATERRKQSDLDPARGLLSATPRSQEGGALGAEPQPKGDESRTLLAGTNTLGGTKASPGVGATRTADFGPEQPTLNNAHARPLVPQNDPSTAALDEGRPNDDIEDPQSVAARMLSLQHASTSGAKNVGEGRGGEKGAGAPGSGGTRGAGQTATPAGAGGNGPADLERNGYVRSVQSKVHPLWANAFPRKAALEGKGGVAVISFTIEADGSVSGARVARSSGIPEFDENVRQAVLRGAPYAKPPASLGPRFGMSITFNSPNPAVKPKFSGDGPQ